MNAPRPTDRDTIAALRFVGECMGTGTTWQHAGRFYFPVDDRWSLAVSPHSAGRFRVEACFGGRPVATMYSLGMNRDRLADLVAAFRAEVEALTI